MKITWAVLTSTVTVSQLRVIVVCQKFLQSIPPPDTRDTPFTKHHKARGLLNVKEHVAFQRCSCRGHTYSNTVSIVFKRIKIHYLYLLIFYFKYVLRNEKLLTELF